MKISLRAAAIFLSFVLSAVPLYSCAADTTTASDTTAPTAASTSAVPTTEDRLYPDLPEADFKGYEFTFLSRLVSGWVDAFIPVDLYAESENGEVINDAVYKRNLAIEEKYNVKIKELKREMPDEFASVLRGTALSGDGAFDAATIQPASGTSWVLEGLFTNLNTVPNIDLTNPWWDQNANKALTIQDTLYYAFGDLIIMDNSAVQVILFNKKLINEYGLENPYNLVKNDQWTFDKFIEMCQKVARDLNGDGIMNYDDDLYAFLAQNDAMPAFYNASGELFAKLSNDGMPEISFYNDRAISVLDKFTGLFYDENISVNAHKTNDHININTRIFSEGRGLFYWIAMFAVQDMRGLDLDFGILPVPKYDNLQENYYCSMNHHGSYGIAVPKSNPDLNRTGIILEALSAESKYTLQPAYYDKMLIGKYSRDDESKEMLDIIYDNVIVDIGVFYDFGGFATKVMQMALTNDKNITSLYEKNEKLIQQGIDNFTEKFNNIE